MDLSTLSEEKNKWIRLSFTRFLQSQFGLNVQTAYGKLRRGRVRKWELVGIEHCIREFNPDYVGDLKDFLESTESKTKFYAFMEKEYEMSAKTAFVRFQQFKFSELELKGINAAYDEFIALQKEKA